MVTSELKSLRAVRSKDITTGADLEQCKSLFFSSLGANNRVIKVFDAVGTTTGAALTSRAFSTGTTD